MKKAIYCYLIILAMQSLSYAVTGDVSIEGGLNVTKDVSIGVAGASVEAATGRFFGNFTGDGAQLINVPSVLSDYAVTEVKIATSAVTAPKISTSLPPADGQYLTYTGSSLTWESLAGTGSVTAVFPGAGIAVSPSPITTTGTISVIATSDATPNTIMSRDAGGGSKAGRIEAVLRMDVGAPSVTSSPLAVKGTIESQGTGGFRFPNADTQLIGVTIESKSVVFAYPDLTMEAYVCLPHNAYITAISGYVKGGTNVSGQFLNNGNQIIIQNFNAGVVTKEDGIALSYRDYNARDPIKMKFTAVTGTVESATLSVEYRRR